jgi:hypothetical protein
VKITLTPGYGEYYRPCCICGEGFETGPRLAMAYVDTRRLGYVCPTCMRGGAAAMKATLQRRAQELTDLTEREIDCPPWEPETT